MESEQSSLLAEEENRKKTGCYTVQANRSRQPWPSFRTPVGMLDIATVLIEDVVNRAARRSMGDRDGFAKVRRASTVFQ